MTESKVIIDCCLRFNRRALKTGPRSNPGTSYADLVEQGIEHHWSGTYDLSSYALPKQVTVQVHITREKIRRQAYVSVRHLWFMPAHVCSPFYRRFWGIWKTGQIESIGLNWSPEQPGRMVMPPLQNIHSLHRTAAHEAGHLFGIGDAYGAIYRYYSPAPRTERYMMHSNQVVHAEEIVKIITAHRTGKMQYFEKTWQTARFFRGLKKEIMSQVRKLKRCLTRLFLKKAGFD